MSSEGGVEETPSSMEVEALVALAAANRMERATVPRRGTKKHQLVLVPKEHHQESMYIDNQTAHVVDAFAAILVQAPRHEVNAVGIQLGVSRSGCVTFTVSSNQDVPSGTVDYIKDVWRVLGLLSYHYKRLQNKNNQAGQSSSHAALPQIPLEDPDPSLYFELTRLVYNRCMRKFLKRLRKHHSEMLSFYHDVFPRVTSKGMDATDEEANERFKHLYFVFRSLMEFYDWGEDKIRSSLQEGSFIEKMTNACLWVEKLTTYGGWLETLFGDEYNNVWRHLKRATAFQVAILDLVRLACSRRMSPLLKRKLEVYCLDLEKGNLLPISTSHWESIMDGTLVGYEKTEKLKSAVEIARTAHGGKNGIVHCELKILKHFASHPDNIPPISYIGASKLACLGCWTVFKAWNDAHESPKYVLRGSNGKWYFPWAIPNIESESEIGKRVREAVVQCMSEENLCRVRSDSSAPSNNETTPSPKKKRDQWDDDYEMFLRTNVTRQT